MECRLRESTLGSGVTVVSRRSWSGLFVLAFLLCMGRHSLHAQTTSPQLTVTTPANQKVSSAPAANFTGAARVQALFGALAPGRSSGGLVTFHPGARTNWHTHPLGQVLIVTDGEGWLEEWGQPRRTIRKGDVVQIPAGVKHWHGATATTSMTHIAVQEVEDGKNVNWLEPVTDAQYTPENGGSKESR